MSREPRTAPTPGPYSIGSVHWPGLSNLAADCAKYENGTRYVAACVITNAVAWMVDKDGAGHAR